MKLLSPTWVRFSVLETLCESGNVRGANGRLGNTAPLAHDLQDEVEATTHNRRHSADPNPTPYLIQFCCDLNPVGSLKADAGIV